MPLVTELFAEFGDIELMAGRDIQRRQLLNADVLLVRSVTRVDQALLEGTSVAFVGSATIGTDHIDLEYLHQAGIQFAHAPGCNAEAVVQYDLSVMSYLEPEWQGKTLGIIGCGNVGGRLYRRMRDLGIRCKVYDPFLSESDIPDLTDLGEVLACDIICVHTPLTTGGTFPTYHMLDLSRLQQIGAEALVINAGRGPVLDNQALLQLYRAGSQLRVALDVWESEPGIDTELLNYVSLATPHIAGYSLEGKVNGTYRVFEAFKQWAGIEVENLSEPVREEPLLLQAASLNGAILECYDVSQDHRRMIQAMSEVLSETEADAEKVVKRFDQLRRDYPVRREFSHYAIDRDRDNLDQYRCLGFRVL